MNNEFDALIRNQTRTLVPPVSSVNIIGWKRVYRIKGRDDGQIKQFKARFIAKACHQHKGVDF